MNEISRRTFGRQSLSALLSGSLLETCWTHGIAAAQEGASVGQRLRALNALSRDVKDQKLRQIEWQQQAENLLAGIDLPELFSLLDINRVTESVTSRHWGLQHVSCDLSAAAGLSSRSVFRSRFVVLKKGRPILPHGHNNMTTALLVLRGRCWGRHYERLEDQENHLLIEPTVDRSFGPGEVSTVSDYRDNIHWFTAESERACLLSLRVSDVRPGSNLPTGRVDVNPRGEKISGGMIRAPRIDDRGALQRFD